MASFCGNFQPRKCLACLELLPQSGRSLEGRRRSNSEDGSEPDTYSVATRTGEEGATSFMGNTPAPTPTAGLSHLSQSAISKL